jgi:hypothetical protein
MRHFILIRLFRVGFKLRLFLGEDDKSIFCILSASEELLRTTAQKEEIPKELRLGFCDLLALEPVDFNLRPLRLHSRLWRKSQPGDEASLTFLTLKPKIVKLIKTINFKKLARELSISTLNNSLFEYGEQDLLDET